MARTTTTYELYYWPGIQGRGEFVRLALEEAGAAYRDVAREPGKKGGAGAIAKVLGGALEGARPFAPPALKAGRLVIAQTANILDFLGQRHGLQPANEALAWEVRQHQMTVTDFVAEVHDAHHPISMGLYYEDQKAPAKARTKAFLEERVPKYLGYFEQVLRANSKGKQRWLVGSRLTYVDLSLFQLQEGLEYAFPNFYSKFKKKVPLLSELRTRVAARPRISAYVRSERRIPFNTDGIFRHYPELDRA